MKCKPWWSGLKIGLCFHFFSFVLWPVLASLTSWTFLAVLVQSALTLSSIFSSKKLAFSLGDHSTSCSLPSRAFWLVCPTKTPLLIGYLFTGLLDFCVPVFSSVMVSVVTVGMEGVSSAHSFLVMSGSQRKNSCRSVLTVSGHSIMTMWLPSSITFKKANRRIWKYTECQILV